MKFRFDATRRVALRFHVGPRVAKAVGAALGAVLAGALLASCGGGEQVSKFSPTRVIVFGDETSVIDNDGSKYTVNALATGSTALDCVANPIWVQDLATAYRLAFPQCPGTNSAPNGLIFATPGAKAADVAVQVDQQVTAGGFGSRDLVTVLVGANDVLEQYAQYPSVGVEQLKTQLRSSGAALATQVNRIGNLGGKVLVSNVPDVGVTPYALAQKAAFSDTDRAALLTALTAAFNEGMRSNLINDGRMIGLLLSDELIDAISKNPGGNGYANVTLAACSVALPACNANTLIPDPNSTSGATASATTWLWADDLHLSAGGHKNLGSIAITRAGNNPF
ncbi:hypothetical protein BH11PSE8_BH11PSE8_32320 [soil metagenome]